MQISSEAGQRNEASLEAFHHSLLDVNSVSLRTGYKALKKDGSHAPSNIIFKPLSSMLQCVMEFRSLWTGCECCKHVITDLQEWCLCTGSTVEVDGLACRSKTLPRSY